MRKYIFICCFFCRIDDPVKAEQLLEVSFVEKDEELDIDKLGWNEEVETPPELVGLYIAAKNLKQDWQNILRSDEIKNEEEIVTEEAEEPLPVVGALLVGDRLQHVNWKDLFGYDEKKLKEEPKEENQTVNVGSPQEELVSMVHELPDEMRVTSSSSSSNEEEEEEEEEPKLLRTNLL